MHCTSARSNWELYHDSEGDSQLYREVNEHLARCPGCRQWFNEQQAFEGDVTTRLRDVSPSPLVWARVEQLLGEEMPAPVRRGVPLLRYLAVAASLLALMAVWQFSGDAGAASSDLTGLVSAHHEQLAGGYDQLQFESESDLAVEAYLKNRVTFPVRCPPRQDAGFAVRGGGVFTIGGAPAAYVHGLVEAEKVSVFILPRERLVQFGLDQDSLQGSRVVHRRIGTLEVVLAGVDQNLVVVVGRQSPERLERVVRAYGTYPENHGHDAA